jgi:hypothetical protein
MALRQLGGFSAVSVSAVRGINTSRSAPGAERKHFSTADLPGDDGCQAVKLLPGE